MNNSKNTRRNIDMGYISGTMGNDTLKGTSDWDVIFGHYGDDYIPMPIIQL